MDAASPDAIGIVLTAESGATVSESADDAEPTESTARLSSGTERRVCSEHKLPGDVPPPDPDRKWFYWVCPDCSHEILAEERPAPIEWADGHRCRFELGPFEEPPPSQK